MSGNDVLNIIKEARRRDIVLFLEGGKLKYKTAGQQGIDRSFIDELVKYKDEIRSLLDTDVQRHAEIDWSKIKHERSKSDHVPLSYNQERLWFIHQLEGSVHYHIPWVMRLKGNVNVDALAASFETIVNRHEVLRSVLREEGGVSYQQVMPMDRWQMERIEAGYSQELVSSLIERPFDLSNDHMIRVHLINVADQEYILVVNIHHIAADGWSWGILMGELTRLYNAYAQGKEALLPPLEIQYADHAFWQRQYLQGTVLEEKLDYWRRQLKDVAVLELPVDHVRPAVQSTKGTNAYLPLDKALVAGLRTLSMENGTTMFMTLLSVFKILLYRYSGQEDICVGTPIAGRTQQETEDLIGFFVNTLALRSNLGGNPSFKSLLQKIKAITLESYEHQDVPFAKIVESVVTERDLSKTPLFQVMFVLQNMRGNSETDFADVTTSYESLTDIRSKFDFTFMLIESAGGLDLYVEYCTDLFKASTIDRMMTHYRTLLEAVVREPGKSIGELRMLTQQEEEKVLNEFNDTAVDYPKNKTLVDLITEQAKRTPGNTAVVFKEQQLTYKELNERSNQLAHYLRKRGVKEESLVAICLDRSLEMIIGIVGILKAGAAYVPIDPEYPSERISYMLEDTGAEVILTRAEWPDISNEPTTPPAILLKPQNLAYVIYTSGSTGKPKGVMNQHDGVVNRLLWMQDQFNIDASDSVLQKTTFCFDVSVWELLWPLMTGAKLVFAEPGGHRNTEYLKQLIEEQSITTLHFVPSMLEVFLQEVEHGELKGLKNVMCSGEELKPHQAALFKEKLSHAGLHNLYGPTEAAIDVTCWTMPEKTEHVSIGKPVANTQLYILDKAGHPTPIGVSGELHIGGIQVARGYLNRHELTAEKFINWKSQKLYKTGDLARWLPDGNIEYLGRIDDQVKIRGYRIEPGEIASVIQQSGLVRQCVVIVRNSQLIGYVVTQDFNQEALINYLKKHLPEYMVPNLWVQLDSIPLTSNGKLDRKNLPDAEAPQKTYTAPRNELETTLAEIWQELLGADRIGIHDSFFSLGGHSLLATRLVSSIRKKIGAKVPIRDVFVYPTIAGLADHINQLLNENGTGAEVVNWAQITTERKNTHRIPLSYSQERLWFIDQLEGSTHYHIPWIMRLKGNVNIQALETSFSQIVNRHEVLRTVLREDNGISYQQILEKDNWQMEKIHTGYSKELISSLIEKPFDLSNDHMIRVHLISIAEHEYILLVNIHHIATDGWSWGILMTELTKLYNSYGTELPPLAIQYADYAFWQRKYLNGTVLEEKLNYWRRQLKDVAILELPTDYARPAVQSTKGSNAYLHIEEKLVDQLRNISMKTGSTMFMTLLSVFKILLYRYSGQQDICVGTPIAGRTQQETEGLIGFFVNTLALRTDLSGNPAFNQLLEKVKVTTLESYEHQDVPFAKIVESVVTERDLRTSPLFQVMFVLQNMQQSAETGLADISITYEAATHTHSKFDLAVTLVESGKGIDLYVEYCTDLFKASTIEQMMQHYCVLINSVASNPAQKIGELQMLTPQEEQKILKEFNATSVDYPKETSIINLFAEQVKRTPGNKAIVFGDQHLTYKELDERSNQVAHYLISQGIAPENNIGLFSARIPEMIICMFGILKAGCAYVPFNTSYPEERLNFIIRDAGIAHVVYSAKIITDSFSKHLPGIQINPSTVACIMYTSGTTGQPKGIAVTHKNIINLVNNFPYAGLTHDDVMLQWSNYAFDGSTYEIYSALLHGASLCMIEESAAADVLYLSKIIQEQGITVSFLTTALFNAFIDVHPSGLNPLRKVLFGGEMASAAHVMKARAVLGPDKLVHVYGPTETTVFANYCPIDEMQDNIVPIGKPIPNASAFILDINKQIVPAGVPGELCISGDGVSPGYLNRPELTAERFINWRSQLLYRTGDLARWLPDGNIEYLGRIDDQVKIRGYRIEPEDINNVIQQSGLVHQSVVIAKKDKTGNYRLVGYVLADADFNKEPLISYLKKHLPDYMVPILWVKLDAIPLTSNGKLDRKNLPDVNTEDISTNAYVAHRNAMETTLAGIWQQLLGAERIGIYDNFFSLGGHSLLATRLVSFIRKTLGVTIPIKDIFVYPTIAGLANHIKELLSHEDTAKEIVDWDSIVQERRNSQRIPLSYSQERLWFIHQLEGSTHYHIPWVMRLKGDINAEALSSAFKEIVNRHEVLRTVLREEEGVSYQQVLEQDNWQMEIIKTGYSEELISSLAEKPFDLSTDHMIRVHLISVADQEYILLINIHHVATDGWSSGILMSELTKLYNAYAQGKEILLPPITVQYADYAFWQRRYLHGAVLEEKLDYWRNQLKNVPVLELPADYIRPAIQSVKGSFSYTRIEHELATRLHDLSWEAGTTMFMTLLSVFKVLLYRYSRQEDICVGTPIAGRTQQETEGLIGFFVNTLALRTDLSGDPSFNELLEKVKATTLESYEHQDVPFEKVVESVVTERDLSRSPLFQVMFVLQNMQQTGETGFENIKTTYESFAHTHAKYDLGFTLEETSGGIDLYVEYCTDLFNASTIERMMHHYYELLNSAVSNPAQSIGKLSMLTGQEEAEILSMCNGPRVTYSRKTIVDLFTEQAIKTPHKTAIVSKEQQLTYKELHERSNHLAHNLIEQGIEPGSNIGLFSTRTPEMIISMLGILKAGCAYVPFNTNFPAERLKFIMDDAGITYVVYANQIPSGSTAHSPVIKTDASAAAYIMYTSGTTGRPKGIAVSHQNVINVNNYAGLQITPDDKMLQWANYSFDPSIAEIYGALLNGASLHLIDESAAADPYLLSKIISEQGITVSYSTAALFNTFIDDVPDGLRPLRRIIFGGEKASPVHVMKALSILGPGKIINAYGPTETTVHTVCYMVNELKEGTTIPIGKPISNSVAFILDPNLQLVPVGVPGELCIGGDGVSLGYVNRPELTAERFINWQSQIVYRTGDLARWMPDGNIEFLGRIDDQVKIRGYRIEPAEIESIIQQSGLVHQGVVIARNGRLIGYVVADDSFNREALINYLKEQLPDYMVPTLWVQLDAIPLTSNGKVDRKSLPDAEVPENTYTAPRNELETTLANIWQQLLGIERIGIHDNFFSLGGHSLLATRLVSFIRKSIEIILPIRDVFVYPTIAGLSGHIKELSGDTKPAIDWEMITAQRKSAQRIPLSYGQERLWFVHQLEGSTHYHMPWIMRLKGNVNVEALESSFKKIINRHEVLRTVLREEGGVSYQQLLNADSWQIKTEETSVDQLIQQPFDLSNDYMIRVHLINVADQEYMLLVNIHHIAADGWSLGILISELTTLYNAYVQGKKASLPLLTIQYADYAFWQRQHLQGSVLEEKLDYWRKQLKDAAVLELPTDYARAAVQSTKGRTAYLRIEDELAKGIRDLSMESGATMFMTLLSVFKVLLYRYSSLEDICVGTSIAGRTQQETEGLIGFFINTLVLRSNLGGNPSFRSLLQNVKTTTLESYEHQDVPFEKIVESVVTERDLSTSPLVPVMFVLQNLQEVGQLKLDGITTQAEDSEYRHSKFDLTVTVVESGKGIDLYVEYCTDLFKAATIERLMHHYRKLLRSVTSNPEQKIGELRMLAQQEEEKILNEFNATSVAFPKEKSIVELFSEQVARTPDNTAIVFKEQLLTYKELNERSNQLAHYLLLQGIKPGSNIGLLSDRTPEMISSILGILKAGCAYVPFNTSYPEERLNFIMEDAGISYVVHADQIPSGSSTNSPAIKTDPDAVAYIMYTSGTTGRPKGIAVTHRNIINLALTFPYANLSGDDVMLQWSNFAFDGSTYEIYGSLLHGASLCMIEEAAASDALLLSKIIEEKGVTVSFLTTALFNAFIDADPAGLGRLQKILFGGEMVSPAHVTKALSVFGAGKLVHVYGPTETTVFATYYPINTVEPGATIPIGKPLPNTNAFILDANNQIVPIGVPGELCISGEGVSLGYLNRDDLTAEKFINWQSKMLYRTGDLARWLPDGNIEYIGRIDDQVKIRGYRIEPAEIASIIQQSGLVRQAVVIAKKDRLIGYVVADDFDKDALIDHLRKHLPEYMIPNLWVQLESIPLTTNGKLDRKNLPDAEATENTYTAPRNELETTLANIWQDLLEVDRIGIHDNFFSLGGHSLLLIQVVTRAKELNCHLQFQDLFEYQTIAELSAHLNTNSVSNGTEHPNIKLLNQGDPEHPLFLLPGSPGFCDGYEELTKAFEDLYMVYGLQMPGLREGEKPLHSIEAMAEQSIQWIKQVQPLGPYRFIGHSLGGSIIFEIAKQLEQQNETVEFICILDKPVHFAMTPQFKDQMTILTIREFLKQTELITVPYPDWLAELESSLGTSNDKISFIMNFLRQKLNPSEFIWQILYVLLLQTEMEHEPEGKINADIILIKAEEENWPGEYLGWESHSDNIHLIKAPGDHRSMVKNNNAFTLVEKIKKHIKHEIRTTW